MIPILDQYTGILADTIHADLRSVQAKIEKDGDAAVLTDSEKFACCITAGCAWEIAARDDMAGMYPKTTGRCGVVVMKGEIIVYEQDRKAGLPAFRGRLRA